METVVRDIQLVGDALITAQAFHRGLAVPNLTGKKIESIFRKGKFIVFELSKGYVVSHLRMTGQWRFEFAESTVPGKFDRGFFSLKTSEGKKGYLIFSDIRKFGTVEWIKTLLEHKGFSALGPDGLTILDPKVQEGILARVTKSSKPIKNLILDQTVIAGVGNIYASDALWYCKIHPDTPAKECADRVEELCCNLHWLFTWAIEERGSSVSDYKGGNFHNYLKAYGKAGEPCSRCDTKIERIVQAGRSTFYCPNCQR